MTTNQLRISLLGPFQITSDGNQVALKSGKAQALLAFLAVERDQPHRRESLAGLLWPDQLDSSALHNLRQALNQLRQALADQDADTPLLLVTRQSLQINPEANHSLDVTACTGSIAACRKHAHARLETCRPCARRLEQAAALYRGDLLSGLSPICRGG